MFLLSICQWLDSTRLNAVMRQSNWAFPTLDTIHTLGIVLVAGTIMLRGSSPAGSRFAERSSSPAGRSHRAGYAGGLRIDAGERRSAVLVGSREDVSQPGLPHQNASAGSGWAQRADLPPDHLSRRRELGSWLPSRRLARALAGLLSLVFWIAIIAAGRAIAYAPGYDLG